MELPRYEILPNKEVNSFTFISKGKKGKIEKGIFYEQTTIKGVFNLVLGDRDPLTGKLDDKVVTDNGDTEKVLATVAATVYSFTDSNPTAYIFARGSTHSRNRLYRRGIAKYLSQALEDFIIYGMLPNEEFEIFTPTTDYIGFLIQRKMK